MCYESLAETERDLIRAIHEAETWLKQWDWDTETCKQNQQRDWNSVDVVVFPYNDGDFPLQREENA